MSWKKKAGIQLVGAEPFLQYLNPNSATTKSFQISQARNTNTQTNSLWKYIASATKNSHYSLQLHNQNWHSWSLLSVFVNLTGRSVSSSSSRDSRIWAFKGPSCTRIVMVALYLWSLPFFSIARLFGSLCLVKPQPQKRLVKTFPRHSFFPLKNRSFIKMCCCYQFASFSGV